MKKIVVLLAFGLLSSLSLSAQPVQVVKMEGLPELLTPPSEGVKVINFWATWCRPCIAELPHFEEAYRQNKAAGLELVLITLDDVEDLERRVLPFVTKKALSARVYLLDETDQNKFINLIDPNWGGAIPATIVLAANGDRQLYEKPLSAEELNRIIEPFLN